MAHGFLCLKGQRETPSASCFEKGAFAIPQKQLGFIRTWATPKRVLFFNRTGHCLQLAPASWLLLGIVFYMFACCGLVVEIQPLNCEHLNLCSPSTVKQVKNRGEYGLSFGYDSIFSEPWSQAKGFFLLPYFQRQRFSPPGSPMLWEVANWSPQLFHQNLQVRSP